MNAQVFLAAPAEDGYLWLDASRVEEKPIAHLKLGWYRAAGVTVATTCALVQHGNSGQIVRFGQHGGRMWASAFVAACGVALDQVHVEVLINSKSEVVTCGAHQDAAVAASIFCPERGIGAEQSCTDHIADAIRTEQHLHASTHRADAIKSY